MAERITRREFIGLSLLGAGAAAASYGAARGIKNYIDSLDGPEPTSIDVNSYKADVTNVPLSVATIGSYATETPYPTHIPEDQKTLVPTEQPTQPPEKAKPYIDQYTIAERINLASQEPMRWLITFPNGESLLTPIAKPYAYSPENEAANVFDWRNHTTYTYLEKNATPILWGHEGIKELFFDSLAEYIRRPTGGSVLTRREVVDAFNQNVVGTKVYLMQAADESLLPKDINSVNLNDNNLRFVEMKITAGLIVPRLQTVDSGGQVTFDGSGKTIDWVAGWYEKHTMDIYEAIEKAYIDTILDPNLTHRRFLGLPTPETLGVKFCIKRLAGDPAVEKDSNGIEISTASYGRVFLALTGVRGSVNKIPSWTKKLS